MMYTSTIDKFGRSESSYVVGIRGPPGIGFKLTSEENYDIQGKRLCNINEPSDLKDAATRNYVDTSLKKHTHQIRYTLNAVNNNNKTTMDLYANRMGQIETALRELDVNLRTTITRLDKLQENIQPSKIGTDATPGRSTSMGSKEITEYIDSNFNNIRHEFARTVANVVNTEVLPRLNGTTQKVDALIETVEKQESDITNLKKIKRI